MNQQAVKRPRSGESVSSSLIVRATLCLRMSFSFAFY